MKNTEVKLIFLFLSFFWFLSITFTFAQSSRFSINKFINNQGDTLNYRLLNPDYNTLRKYPLVIFLHGSGERGNDNEAQLKWGVMNFATDQAMTMHPALVVAPQCPEKQGWSNFTNSEKPEEVRLRNTPSKPMELVIQLIHKLSKELPVDTTRIYITGLSMGGFGTFDAIERYPHLFAAAVPVCGGGDVSKAATIMHIPIWILHGSEDAAVNPQFSIYMVKALTEAGAHPGFTLYPEVGHFSWLAAYSDPLMIEWMFRQHK
ncbi:MAG: prolyl oligopeptidase family serine peptidase [Bacteroidia bacterium]|nr:prolyl oligopeptidase family serine peptidase [Bacteroidia bacterium]